MSEHWKKQSPEQADRQLGKALEWIVRQRRDQVLRKSDERISDWRKASSISELIRRSAWRFRVDEQDLLAAWRAGRRG